MKKIINRNFYWASLFVEQLFKLGIKDVVISPGSRNTPLTLAFAESKKFEQHVIIDERSAAFFSLGLTKQSKIPTVVVTTSGTAVAELYPAIIEAYKQRVPLIICTADRPKYLQNRGANQTINQHNIFSNHIRFFSDLGLPILSSKNLKELCHKTLAAVKIATQTNPGPVHLNFPFEKPLEPKTFSENYNEPFKKFLIHENKTKNSSSFNKKDFNKVKAVLQKKNRVLFHLGWDNFDDRFYKLIIKVSNKYSIPIFIDGTNKLRFTKSNSKNLITNHNFFVKKLSLLPDIIVHFGNAPTSNNMLEFFKNVSAQKIIVNEFGDITEPSSTKRNVIKINPTIFLESLLSEKIQLNNCKQFSNEIIQAEKKSQAIKEKFIAHLPFGSEIRIITELLKVIGTNSNLFISNSLPIRDFDNYAFKNNLDLNIFTNRGSSGIDGIISTAGGIAQKSKRKTFLIVGDLAFYHNINAFILFIL